MGCSRLWPAGILRLLVGGIYCARVFPFSIGRRLTDRGPIDEWTALIQVVVTDVRVTMRVLRELLFWSVAAGAILGCYILAADVALCSS